MAESPARSSFTYRAFISYSHQDKAWGDWLHKALETYRVPSRLVGKETEAGTIPRRLNPIFRDREELSSSPELGARINEALGQSECMVVICSPASAASRWVNEEVLAFKRLGRSERIFCVIVAGEPNATDTPRREAEECFCPALRFKLDASGQLTSERTEPIAADARPGKDGKPNAKLKLIAGMLGVGFDVLKQREQRRKVQRMTAITSVAVAVMVITIGLAVFALIARHQAMIAQHQAQVAQQTAQRRQKQAEDLVNFMLGDLTTKLRGIDKLSVLSAVDAKAMTYFKSLPATDVNATELAERAKDLQRIGEVRMSNSHLSDSMDAFHQALRLDQQLVRQNPADPLRQNAYAENLLWVGLADWENGKTGLAEAAFKRSAAALEHAVALAPSNDHIAHNLDDVYNNLGHVAQARGELDVAEREYKKDQVLCRRMAASHPDDVIWQDAIGDAYGNLAALALMRGHIDQAIAGYLQEQHTLRDVVARRPQDRQMQESLLADDSVLIRTLELAGPTQATSSYIDSALQIGKSLLAFDPNHQDWRHSYAYAQLLAARAAWERGDATAAATLINASLANFQQLVRADPSNTGRLIALASARLEAARLALAHHQFDTAATLATKANAAARKLLAGDSPKASPIRVAAHSELLLGRLAAERGNAAVARAWRKQALVRIQKTTMRSTDPRDTSILAEALLANGDTAQAKSVLRRLATTGYASADFVARLRDDGIDYTPSPAVRRYIAQIGKSVPASSSLVKTANR